MAKRSVYKELTHSDEIRVLELQPGRSPQLLSCKLRHVSLGQNHEYEALSYEWGNPDNTGKVRCDSVDIDVRSNLLKALEVLRYEKNARLLWVDALCIDQNDDEERSKQVPLMRKIYSKAQTVLVWLGTESSISGKALEIINSLALVCIQRMGDSSGQENYLPFKFQDGEPLFTSKDAMYHISLVKLLRGAQREKEKRFYFLPGRDDSIFRFDDALLWNEVHEIFGSSYFQRSWIIQEVSVADDVNIICLNHSIPWKIFECAYRGWELVQHKLTTRHEEAVANTAPFSGVRDARMRFRKPPNEFDSDLASVLATFNYTKQSNTRDHIYAALGLVTAPLARAPRIVPDYTKSTVEVFIEAATHIINERQDLYLWGLNKPLSSRCYEMQSLPTWVPDWIGKEDGEGKLWYSKHLSNYVASYFEIQGRRLLVNGIVEKIIWVAPELDNIVFLSQLFPLLFHLENTLNKDGSGLVKPYPEGFSDIGLSAKTYSSLISDSNYLVSLKGFIKILV